MIRDKVMGDEVFIESPSGEKIGPVKASVQGNKVYVYDESLVIEEGGKILRPLPNGKCESHTIQQVDFFRNPIDRNLSRYTILTRKESSLVPIPSATTINISHSQGIQIGDGNVQHIVASLEMFIEAIDSADCPADEKADAKQKLKALLSHPLTVTILGAAAGAMASKL